MQKQNSAPGKYFKYSGKRYWTAVILPALLGTTLPFWLDPPHFKFQILAAILFLIITLTGYIGFSLLYHGFNGKIDSGVKRKPLFVFSLLCFIVVVALGLLLNSSIPLHPNVPKPIFLIYGATCFFIGILYIVPPFRFHQRLYGELILSVGLGLMPVLGAYLVQVGDITRTVYIASIPVVVVTGLWSWITNLSNYEADKKKGYKTTVMYLRYKFSRRLLPLLFVVVSYLTLVLAVFGRRSLHPLALVGLGSVVFAVPILRTVWKDDKNIVGLKKAEKNALLLHLYLCLVMIITSLAAA